MPIEMVTVDVDALDAFVQHAFLAMGLSQREAGICAAGLMSSELRCLPGQGQGVARLTGYYDRISKGLYQPGTCMEVVKESPALALIDAKMVMGSVVGQDAMDIAVAKAKVCGIGAAFVFNSTHFGSSGFHARRALESDCIGIAITNAGAEMAPWGGREARVGTNPWGAGGANRRRLLGCARYRPDHRRQGHDALARARRHEDAARLGADASGR